MLDSSSNLITFIPLP